MSTALAPVRRWTAPLSGEDWTAIAARVFPGEAAEASITALKSWNMHLLYRPPPALLVCSDVIFIEAPKAA
jgi:hypothetical protein